MKNKINLLALSISLIATPVFADDNISSKPTEDYDNYSEAILIQQKKLELINLQNEIDNVSNKSEEEKKKISEEYEEKLKKMSDFYIKKIEELKGESKKKMEELEEELDGKDQEFQDLLVDLEEEELELSIESAMETAETEVSVLKIKGYGSDLTAKVYLNNQTYDVRKGDYISKDIYVEEIALNGARFSVKGKSVEKMVVNNDTAYFKSYKDLLPVMTPSEDEQEEGFADSTAPMGEDFSQPFVQTFFPPEQDNVDETEEYTF